MNLAAQLAARILSQATTTLAKESSDPILRDPTPLSSDGYLYRLFRELGLTRKGAITAEFLILGPLRVFGIILLAFLAARIGKRLLRKFVTTLRLRAPLRVRTVRSEQRARTVGEAIGSLWVAVVGVLSTLMVLQQIGVNLGPLLAGAGIAGVALAFGAQSLIRDYLSGLFILLEDQYSVGDVVTIGTSTGTVEDVSLRLTRLRAADGTVWFVPNGEVRAVGNLSMEWSRAVVDVTVAYDNDIATVLSHLSEEATRISTEQPWAALILEPPEMQGVQSMGSEGVSIRIVAKTQPRKQWEVARELRARITERMRRDGVKGPGRTVLVSSTTLDSGSPVPPPPEALDL